MLPGIVYIVPPILDPMTDWVMVLLASAIVPSFSAVVVAGSIVVQIDSAALLSKPLLMSSVIVLTTARAAIIVTVFVCKVSPAATRVGGDIIVLLGVTQEVVGALLPAVTVAGTGLVIMMVSKPLL